MNNDILIGFLLALPLYGLVLLLFKDIIVHGFIKRLVESSKAELIDLDNPTGSPFSAKDFKEAVENDLLTSYKLLLVLRDQFQFLCQSKSTKLAHIATEKLIDAYSDKVRDLNYTLMNTEKLFEEMGNTEYLEIKKNFEEMLSDRSLF